MHIPFRCSLAASCAVAGVLAAPPAFAQQRNFNVPAQDARQAIPQFARQAGIQISAPTGRLRGVRTRAIRGNLDARAALRTMIESTGLSIVSDSGSIIILRYNEPAAMKPVTYRVAMAQPAPALLAPSGSENDAAGEPQPPESPAQDIVVTGTLIRGVAPAGTNVITQDAKKIQESGAATVTQLLQTVPQFASFNSLQSVQGGSFAVTTNRPNLRNLPGLTSTGTSPTLLLIDGRRVVGMGIRSTTPDADFVPPGIIERVEIVPDGGSALYGSDAVAGVVNFITMKRFNGVKADARYGFGNDYHTFDANLTVGKEWSDGSLWASYNYAENDTFYGHERDFVFTPDTKIAGVQLKSLECAKPNILISSNGGATTQLYSALSPAAANTANSCDISDDASIYPSMKRHSIYAGLNQQLNSWLEMDMRAFYYRKENSDFNGQYTNSTVIGTGAGAVSSPFNVNVTGDPAERKTVSYAFGPTDQDQRHIKLDSWGVTSSFKADLGGSWQLRAHASYGESKTVFVRALADTNVIPGLISSGQFNPFNPASSSPTALATIFNRTNYAQSDQTQFNARAIADGDLFALPGGMVKLAGGAEYRHETLMSLVGDVVPGNENTIPRLNQTRKIWAVFGEIVLPVFGADNATPGFQALSLTASGRYDRYNDVGGTFNPKLGITWKPIDWVSLRGSWGKSFVAPGLTDNAQVEPTALWYLSGGLANFVAPPAALAANGYPARPADKFIYFLLGTNPGLTPQKAKSWSVGADIDPPFVPGLRLSATYYNLTYDGMIQLLPITNAGLYFSTYASTAFILNPTQAQVDQARSEAKSFVFSACSPEPGCVYGIQDVRKRNLGSFKQSGIDFASSYVTNTSFGSVDFNVGGTYVLTRKNSAVTGAPFVSELGTFNSRLQMRTSLGANIGNLRAQISWNFLQGFDIPPTGLVNQTHVGDFNVLDLFFKYEVPGEGVLRDLAFTLNVNNVFDQDPPLYLGGNIKRAENGYLNGSTVGRLVQIGVSKKF